MCNTPVARSWKHSFSTVLSIVVLGGPAIAQGRDAFSVTDYYVEYEKIRDVAISDDAGLVVFSTETRDLTENRRERTVRLISVSDGAISQPIDVLRDAESFAWLPNQKRLAFISSVAGTRQVRVYDPDDGIVNPVTTELQQVEQFKYSPDGKALAFVATKPVHSTSQDDEDYGLARILSERDTGVTIDVARTGLYDFIDPGRQIGQARRANQLWISSESEAPHSVTVPGRVVDFYWSRDGHKLSIVHVQSEDQSKRLGSRYTSVDVYSLASDSLSTIAAAQGDLTGQFVAFSGGQWSVDGERIFLRRTEYSDAWSYSSAWRFQNVSQEVTGESGDESGWWPLEHVYQERIHILDSGQVLADRMSNAVDGIFELHSYGLVRPDFLGGYNGAVKRFQMTGDGKAAAFICESLTEPNEVCLWREGSGIERISRINARIAETLDFTAQEVVWNSFDGVPVHGWLIHPDNRERFSAPYPLVTFVHGGPGVPVQNMFSPYFFDYNGIWPYPFEALAKVGIAVFLPNYRGTRSFGEQFVEESDLEKEPTEDVVSGIELLISQGVADPSRLGIVGHSHGAWLGPLIMARHKMFLAGSFSEGSGNRIVNYILMSEDLNKTVHDMLHEASLYEDPMRYLAGSPEFEFEGVQTAVLFEAGAQSLAIPMIGYPKASRRAGMPTEYVVYPKTAHTSSLPSMEMDSAKLNLDWLRFWLQGFEDTDPEKANQYARWRKMREQQCERLMGDDSPSYCRQ